MKIKLLAVLAVTSIALHSAALADSCPNCGLKNRSDDQACALGKTPLSRCETLGEYLKSDKELNSAYRKLTKQLDSPSLTVLKKTQREWIKWRDEKCEAAEVAANCTNGVCAGVNHDNCVVELTEKRTMELTEFAKKIPNAQASGFTFEKKYE
ncbi:MAG: lysozyme inhibitor LprI family protein [Pseudomonadota bacterium]